MIEIEEKILKLKKKLNAVIVAHNYQRPEVQDIADFTGDSLELARKCTEIEADVIVFCGVRFMAETATILNPEKKVLLSKSSAGCPLADMLAVKDLREWKKRYPKAVVVCYVNSSAEVKAESDYCCTSANAVKLVNSVPSEKILFVPDQNLGHYASAKTEKQIILYPGYCYVHQQLTPEQVLSAKKTHPESAIMVHPECRPEVIALADAALSTSQMLRYYEESDKKTFLVGTEEGILHQLRKRNSEKEFYLISPELVCLDMKKTTLEKVASVMEYEKNKVVVPEEIRVKAKRAIERMLAV
jgi:quinolinate synthase